MSCEHCVSAINGEVVNVDGVSDVTIDLEAKTVA
ncbi:MAG: cation transporter, partial [Acidimicrobiia bacterium]|nr:cation transporter [Acidimicrobiia bacterium]